MDTQKFWVLSRRFLRGAIAGGLASVTAFLSAGVSITSEEDAKKFAWSVGAAFITGVILAIDKYLRWNEEV